MINIEIVHNNHSEAGLRKRHRILLSALLVLVPALCVAQQPTQSASPQASKPELHVLLIGNSFMYFNNMPKVLEAIAASLPGPRIKTEMVAFGGASLRSHWEQGSALAAIRKGGWDYVVLNEQSVLEDIVFVNQQKQIADPAHFLKYAALFDSEIKKVGAKTVVLMTWKDKNDPRRNQFDLDVAFLKFRTASNTILAPVSLSWEGFQDSTTDIDLYYVDNHHPSEEGSYLIACTLYCTLTGRDAWKAVSKVVGTPFEKETGKILEGKTETLVNISSRDATFIQHAAWSTSFTIKNIGGYLNVPPIEMPTVPVGQRPSIDDLEGTWRGPLRFYPDKSSANIELHIINSSSGLAASLRITHGDTRPEEKLTLSDFQITDQGVSFTNPNGPYKEKIEFIGAYKSESLTGVAKTFVLDTDPSISIIGTWELKKTSHGK